MHQQFSKWLSCTLQDRPHYAQLVAIQHVGQHVPAEQRLSTVQILEGPPGLLTSELTVCPLPPDAEFDARHSLPSQCRFSLFHLAVHFRQYLLLAHWLDDAQRPRCSVRQWAGFGAMPLDGQGRHPLAVAASVRTMCRDVLQLLDAHVQAHVKPAECLAVAEEAVRHSASVSTLLFLFECEPTSILRVRLGEPSLHWLFEYNPMPILALVKRVGALLNQSRVREGKVFCAQRGQAAAGGRLGAEPQPHVQQQTHRVELASSSRWPARCSPGTASRSRAGESS